MATPPPIRRPPLVPPDRKELPQRPIFSRRHELWAAVVVGVVVAGALAILVAAAVTHRQVKPAAASPQRLSPRERCEAAGAGKWAEWIAAHERMALLTDDLVRLHEDSEKLSAVMEERGYSGKPFAVWRELKPLLLEESPTAEQFARMKHLAENLYLIASLLEEHHAEVFWERLLGVVCAWEQGES